MHDPAESPESALSALGYSNFPSELKIGFLFVCWKATIEKDNPNKLKKRPFCPLSGKVASTRRPDDFTRFEYAVHACEDKGYSGVGRLMQHPIDAIYSVDVDDCVDAGELNEYAKNLVGRANSYAEVTPSGTGIRIYGRGILPLALAQRASVKIWNKGAHPSWPGVEVQLFLQGSYVTVSGKKIDGTPAVVTENQEFLDYLLRQNPAKLKTYFPEEAACRAAIATRRLTESAANPTHKMVPADDSANPKRTNSRIKWMRKTSSIYRKNWDRCADKLGKTNSEYQLDLVKHAYVKYQMSQGDLPTCCKPGVGITGFSSSHTN